MNRKRMFFITIVLLFITVNVYLLYSAPEELNKNEDSNQATSVYGSQDLFEILAAVNDEARTLYTKSIVGGGKKVGLKFDEDWKDSEVEAGPLPALFLRETSMLIELNPIDLGLYLGSDYPISEANLFEGLQAKKFQELKIDKSPKYFFDKATKRNMAMFPDYASANACVSCHNNHEQSPKKDWEINDVMGATTWSTQIDSLTTDQMMEYIAVFRNSALKVYGGYLDEVKKFKKSSLPVIGEKWPSDGYYLPDVNTFKDSLDILISKKLMNDLFKDR